MENNFNNHGYLSDEMLDIEKQIYCKNKSLFDLSFELNEEIHKIKFQLNPHQNEGQEVMSVAAFMKTINTYQSLIILANKGLVHESQVMLRVLLEVVITLKLLCEDEEFMREYIQTDLLYRKKLLQAAKDNPHSLFDSTKELIREGMLERVADEVKEKSVRRIGIEEMARRAKMSEFYDSMYRITSSACHSTPRSLEQYVTVDGKSEFESFTAGPFSDVDTEVASAMGLVFIAIKCLLALFKLDESKQLDELANEYIKIKG